MEQFAWDEINNIKNIIMPSKRRIAKHSVCDEYVIFANESPISWYFACAAMLMAYKVDSVRTHIIISDEKANAFINEFLCELEVDDHAAPEKQAAFYQRNDITQGLDAYMKKGPKYVYKKVRICTFLDGTAGNLQSVDGRQQYLMDLMAILVHAAGCPTCKLVHTEILPQIHSLPAGMSGVSEREYEVYCSQFDESSPEHFILKCEETIRTSVKNGHLKAVVSRMQNIYGPGVTNYLVDGIREEMVQSKSISLDTGFYNQFINMNYITFAASQVHYMFVKGRGGHIYNLGQYRTTPYALYTQVFPYLANHNISLNGIHLSAEEPRYRLLACKKAASLLSSKYAKGTLINSFYKSIISGMGLEYHNPNEVFAYDGKLDMIKKIELEMMVEIKRICEKHNIKYFLVGGSMLGAVRHKGFIPWDDDLDIGMLRDDYEKFATVAPKELNSRYYYQSPGSKDNSHYIFDKIRLKDTYFSTKFSDRFQIENGLFIDILVYDKTAKTKRKQNRHIKAICIWSRAINVRWVNVARKGIAYRLTKILLPIMRLVPFKMYHWVFEKILTHYNNTDSNWLIDGVGQNIRKGAFPADWFDELIEVPFEDLMLPIPKLYDEYLKHWYGEKYMQLLPISKRKSGHVMKRIDLGSYIGAFGFKEGNYHHASRQGELYDHF